MDVIQVVENKYGVERLYTYYLEGLTVVRVTNTQAGQTVDMPFRSTRERAVHTDKKGQFIKLGSYKHYLK